MGLLFRINTPSPLPAASGCHGAHGGQHGGLPAMEGIPPFLPTPRPATIARESRGAVLTPVLGPQTHGFIILRISGTRDDKKR